MPPRILLGLLWLTLVAALPHRSLAAGKEACPVTKAPDPVFVPPPPYDRMKPASGQFLYGSPALWALVSPHWRVHGGSKLPYFRQGYDWMKEPDPRLVVVARRLDGAEQIVWAGWTNNASTDGSIEGMFMVTGLSIPTAGCWEIAAHYTPTRDQTQTLIYSVWVEP